MKKIVVAVLAATVLVTPALAATAGPAAGDAGRTAAGRTAQATSAQAPAAAYSITPGVTFNNPRRDDQAFRIVDKIKRSIANTPKGEKIWAMTWNYNSPGITKALISAHQRGVGVRLIMAREIANKQGDNGAFWRLTRALKKGNSGRPGHLVSFTRTCDHACRGRHGSMHSKFVLISRAGQSKNIVQQGSANLTTSAATNQWNDWYALPNNGEVYQAWKKVFTQALRDRSAAAYQHTWRHVYSWFAPRAGSPDPVLKLLNDVRCTGARDAGVNGRTAIRVASAVFQNERGLAIARKLKSLHRDGCNIRVVFTMMPTKIRDAIRGLPVRQLVYDWNSDGAFDRYLHMKAFTISGNFRGDPSARLVFNGSANWSSMGMVSDEQGMVLHSDIREKQYAAWINGLFESAPLGVRPAPEWYRARGAQDPYAGLELELDGQG